MKLAEIITAIDAIYPFSTQEEWDNSGLQVGNPGSDITSVLVALDVTEEVVYEARKRRCQLIVSHHPLFFKGIKTIDRSDGRGKIIATLIRAGIAVVSCHTNLDKAPGGVSAVLGKKLGLTFCSPLIDAENGGGFGVLGMYPRGATLETFVYEVKKALSLRLIKVVGERERPIRTVAVMGGAGGDFIEDAIAANADVFVTADLKYHDGQHAAEKGLALIDAGHFATEALVVPTFRDKLAEAMPEVEFAVAERMKDFWHVL